MNFGDIPTVTLKQARIMRDQARNALKEERDPRGGHLNEYGPKTFHYAAQFWFDQGKDDRWSPAFAKRVWNRVEGDLLPNLEDMALGEITRRDTINALRKIEDRGSLATARIVGGYARDIFALAISEEREVDRQNWTAC